MVREEFTQARIANVVLGVWLFISAFLWPHSYAQRTNTWILGALCVAFALIAMRVAEARYLNTLLAIWLFISVWALPSISNGTRWVNALTAIAIFAVSLTPGYLGSSTRSS
jgi:phosphoglycerol transferase MdoB-like AlkP superfamily enzyme